MGGHGGSGIGSGSFVRHTGVPGMEGVRLPPRQVGSGHVATLTRPQTKTGTETHPNSCYHFPDTMRLARLITDEGVLELARQAERIIGAPPGFDKVKDRLYRMGPAVLAPDEQKQWEFLLTPCPTCQTLVAQFLQERYTRLVLES